MLGLLMFAAAAPSAAIEVRRLQAPEAHQGAAADAASVYAVDNSQVARYDKVSGRRTGLWQGDPKQFKHINSCIVRHRTLVCAASNYPDVPMTSMIVWIDTATMMLRRTQVLKGGPGSLTWLDWHDGSWWAGFANYDGKGGAPGRDHRQTVVVRYDTRFKPRATYRFPDAVLDRFAPRSASGGAWGPKGLLYVTGHDRPELYALRLPRTGTTLDLVATIETPTGGQAFGWDARDRRLLWSIERNTGAIVASRISDQVIRSMSVN